MSSGYGGGAGQVYDPTAGFFNKFCFGWMYKPISAARKCTGLRKRSACCTFVLGVKL